MGHDPQPQTVTRNDRIPELDGLRALAISAVFFHHAMHIPMLWAGVDVFFVLSGFLITGILMNAKHHRSTYFSNFYAKRLRRILPPYCVALLLSSIFFGIAWLHRWYWFAFFAVNIGESIHRSNFSLLPLWSLAVEEQFYFVWPWVVLLVSTRSLKRISIAALFVAPLLRVLCTPLFHDHFAIYFLTPFRADLLCAGGLLAVLWKQDRARLQSQAAWWWVPIVAGIAVLARVNRYPYWHTQANSRISNGALYSVTLVIAVGFVLGALRGRGWFAALLRWVPLRYLGVISYSMYLVHAGAIQLARRWFGEGELSSPSWKMVVTAATMTVGYASIAWFGWERRILHRRKTV